MQASEILPIQAYANQNFALPAMYPDMTQHFN